MMPRSHAFAAGARFLVAAATAAVAGGFDRPALAQAEEEVTAGEIFIEEVVVTAQRRSESLQEVPIAVTAFDAVALERNQIESFSDLQFNAPNVSYTKTNFTDNNFQIRGIGATLIAASSDQGVGIHINDLPLNAPRLFEVEYFDVERIEVLRGPQGTLFGRNATGGVVNMITKKPVLDEYTGFLEVEVGDFSSTKGKGHLNLPVTENVGLRLAGIYSRRDGYTDNVFTGNDIDDRDMYSLRGSLRWEPSETTTIDLMASWFKEDSSRSRSQKQMCNNDPTALLGCLPDRLEFENVNSAATLAGGLVTDLLLGPLALSPFGADLHTGSLNPADFRDVALDFEPRYEADEQLYMISLEQELGPSHILTASVGYQDTRVFSQSDYNNNVGGVFPLLGNALAVMSVALPTTFGAYFSGGEIPISAVTSTNLGVVGFEIENFSTTLDAYDQSSANSDQTMFELRLASDRDSAINYLIGGMYFDFDNETDYYVVANGLDYFSLVGSGVDGVAIPPPYFNSETDFYGLDSAGIFGELYFEFTEALKLTLGARWTRDEKEIRDRQVLLNGAPTAIGSTSVSLPPLHDDTVEFTETTGRVVLDWAATDANLLYVSYARGYKGGGFNPPFDPALFPNTSPTFDPEFINAYEIGSKNNLAGGRVQANLTGFFYDYEGLQVSRIVNRTSFNDNIDAEIWGVEGEFVLAPNESWLINTNVSYLNSEITNASIIDPRDPSNGRSALTDPGGPDDVTIIKDYVNYSNCVIEQNGGPPVVPTLQGLVAVASALAPVFGPLPFSLCDQLAALDFSAFGLPYSYADGIPVNLDGNELQNAPEWSYSMGLQYGIDIGNGYRLTLRGDYYWQDDMFGRIYNRPVDRIESYDVINAQVTLAPPDERWYLKAFVQNLDDDDDITGLYVTDASSGLFTNVFTLEPRRYGVTFGISFE